MKMYNAFITGDTRQHKIENVSELRIRQWVSLQLPGVKIPDELPREKMVIDEADYQLTVEPLESPELDVESTPLPVVSDEDEDMVTELIPLAKPSTLKPSTKK